MASPDCRYFYKNFQPSGRFFPRRYPEFSPVLLVVVFPWTEKVVDYGEGEENENRKLCKQVSLPDFFSFQYMLSSDYKEMILRKSMGRGRKLRNKYTQSYVRRLEMIYTNVLIGVQCDESPFLPHTLNKLKKGESRSKVSIWDFLSYF